MKAIGKYFKECHALLGDFNLSPSSNNDMKKLTLLCGNRKLFALSEITRRLSNNQLDHVLVDKIFDKVIYATSFHNFISDVPGLYGMKH